MSGGKWSRHPFIHFLSWSFFISFSDLDLCSFSCSCSVFFSICFILFFLATMLYQSPESFLTTIFYYFFCECKISECG